ncbi:biotin synthase [Hypoxylon texense]
MYRQNMLTSLLAILAAARGLTVPEGDGVWALGVDTNGEEYHELIQPLDPSVVDKVKRDVAEAGHEIERRVGWPSGSSATCGPVTETAPLLDWNIATAHFETSCSSSSGHLKGDDNHRAVVAKSGDITVYMCSYSKKGNPCNVDEWHDAQSQVENTCQSGGSDAKQSGWFSVPKWSKSYGWQATDDVCG